MTRKRCPSGATSKNDKGGIENSSRGAETSNVSGRGVMLTTMTLLSSDW